MLTPARRVPGGKIEIVLSGSFHRSNGGVQAGFVSSGFVVVDETTTSHFVDYWNGTLVGGFRTGFVTGADGLHDVLDMGPHHGALAHVALPVSLCLSGPLLSLR